MNRDASTLISWDEVGDALQHVAPEPVYAEPFPIEGGWRQLWLGVFIVTAVAVVAVLCMVGAFTVARWLWGVA